jgi:hypothetical protein
MAILITSLALLGSSIGSSWVGNKGQNLATISGAIAEHREDLPPKLDSEEAKASLLYPRMKTRGPLPGGGLTAKPLRN